MQRPMSWLSTILTLLLGVPAVLAADLDVPPEAIEGGTPASMMRRYLLRQVEVAEKRWKTDYENRKTPEDIAAYQKRLRADCLKAIGGLPERTPLEAHVAGAVTRPGYRVEKIIFESQPKHYVTALLFLPEGKDFSPPFPGVLIPCGHDRAAKGYGLYQRMGALLALNGMAAFVFDPIDQGERIQYAPLVGGEELWGPSGHINVGVGSILLGRNAARFEIWDGIRAIDYLQSRPEIDPQRIGCTGCSGGGTQTAFLMALDDRIRCAAPSCFITSLPRLLATIAPQDSEQHLFGQLAFGMDHADMLMMRAPSPVLVCCATHDFFDIGGTWDSFRRAKRLFTRLGAAERVDILENDAEHNYLVSHREGVARWMSRWLLANDRPISEPPITELSQSEYQCTLDGRVMSLPGARSVYDLNQDYENELAQRRAALWAGGDRGAVLDEVRRLAGIRRLSELPKPAIETAGTLARNGYRIEKLLIKPEPGITLPALWFLPTKHKSDRVVLYVHQDGKAADAGSGGPIERLAQAGVAVLAVDVRGTGQTQANPQDLGTIIGYNDDYRDAYIAYLLGRSYVGLRAEDVLVCARYAAERITGGRDGTVRLVAVGNVGIPALHAAALEPTQFQAIAISRTLLSWSDAIHRRLHKNLAAHVVHGALTHYDLPNLVAALGATVTVEQPVNALGVPVAETQ